jgi:hypothetical protein
MTVVRENWPNAGTWLGILMAGMLLGGCTPKGKNSLPPVAGTVMGSGTMKQSTDRWGTDAAKKRVRDLSIEAKTLGDDAKMLPGRDAADHSSKMQGVFTHLLQALPLLQNPDDNRILAQRLTIIETARARLASGAADLAMSPTIDTALRAADAALADISHGDNFEQADFADVFDKLSARINRLDVEHDPSLHRVDVADVVDLISQVVSKMAATLSAKLGVESPATQPASPETQPATTATQPASVPANP